MSYDNHCYPAWLMEARAVFEEAFEAYVYNTFAGTPLEKPTLDAIFPGRRIRPTLYFALWNIHRGTYPRGADALPAYAIELFHEASIVVDDLCDGDCARRGKRPLHVLHSTESALLASHFLVAKGYEALLLHPQAHVLVTEWTSCYAKASIGQAADLGYSNAPSVRLRAQAALQKTTPFFSFVGTAYNEATQLTTPHSDDLTRSLADLGACFQISNDIVDLLFFRESRRHEPDRQYVLRPSLPIADLVEAGVINSNEVLQPLDYTRHLDISRKARHHFPPPEEYIASAIAPMGTAITQRCLSPSTHKLFDDFLTNLTLPSFWLHLYG